MVIQRPLQKSAFHMDITHQYYVSFIYSKKNGILYIDLYIQKHVATVCKTRIIHEEYN